MALCGPMPMLAGDGGDDWARWGGRMVDWGRDCAARHKALSDYVRGE